MRRPRRLRLGSLCSGIGGLDLALTTVLDARLAWVSDNDPAAAKVLAHRFGVPNLGDITTTDWSRVPHVHVISCGAPCQPFSLAGKRKGKDDPRYLWPHVAQALRHLVPDLFVMEQVPGYLSLGLAQTLDDLAALGYHHIRWGVVAASDAGAAHLRKRLFLTATHPQGLSGGAAADPPQPLPAGPAPGPVACGGDRGTGPCTHAPGPAAADPDGLRWQQGLTGTPLLQRPHPLLPRRRRETPADPARQRHRDPGPPRQPGLPPTPVPGTPPSHEPQPQWGEYDAAIRRWEHVLGRPAPHPADEHRRLRAEFVEHLMGFPDGWTDVDHLPRGTRLRLLGAAVQPQQAELALHHLLHPPQTHTR